MAALVVGESIVSAVPTSFAQFSEAAPGGNNFVYSDNVASGATFQSLNQAQQTASTPVNFTYLTVGGTLPVDLQGNQSASLSMTSSTVDPVVTGFGGSIGVQPMTGAGTEVDQIRIIRSTPAAEGSGLRTNLLTVTFTAQLTGILDGRTPQLSANTSLGYTVNYSSDFLTFPNGEKDFSLTFSSWTSAVDGNGIELSNILNSLNFASATAAGAGTFSGTAIVPEPATLTLAGLGLVLSGIAVLRHKRRCRIG